MLLENKTAVVYGAAGSMGGAVRVPRLAEVADTAAFIAADHAGAMTGAVVNLTCGAIVD